MTPFNPSSSSSSCRAASTDITDPLSPLLPIASGMSSGLDPVSSHSCRLYVRTGRPAFARPYAGGHRSTSLMSSSLLFQQCPACLVRLTWIVFVMGGRLPYSWCFVGCCRQDLFNIARNHNFSECNCLKMNVMMRLKFEINVLMLNSKS